jgi:triosephosphate isomerase
MRKIIIAGNWKLNKTINEAVDLVEALKKEVTGVTQVDIVVCPVYTALAAVKGSLEGSNIGLGAQDCFWEDSGAFTGEVSAALLKDAGVQYVVIGHSERRQFFGETDITVNKRTVSALKHGLIPIVCVGETLEERESQRTFDVIKKQCSGSLAGFSTEEMKKIIIAYEPVWAIGTGKTATPDQAQEVHKYIRKLISDMFEPETAEVVRIQYGGSVKPDNAAELMKQPDIDGALVGGASLKADSFTGIIKNSIVQK